MAKWHLLVEEGYSYPEAALVCTDVGEITVVDLESFTDNYPYVTGKVLADGFEVHIHQKHSATAGYQGIYIGHWDKFCKTVPKRVPVRCTSKKAWQWIDHRTSRIEDIVIPKTIRISDIPESWFSDWKIRYVIADPRVIWMAFYVLGIDKWFSAKMCSDEIPTRKEAIANLKHYGLYHPYSKHFPQDVDVYEIISQIWTDFIHRHHEESAAQVWNKKVHFEETTILPDNTRDTFVKNLRVVGSFAVPYFEYTIKHLEPNMRAKLVREPDNPHDSNAIRVEAPFIRGEKLGYIPRTEAAVFAPEIDSGITYAAWINSVDREKRQVFIDIYKRVQFPIDDVTSIHFVQNGYEGEQISFKLSLGKRKLVCTKRESWGDLKEQYVELIFAPECWEDILARLQKCNLPGWRRAYHSYCYGGTRFWELAIRRRKASRILISGCNDYPEEWESFMQLVNDCLDMNKTKGDGKVFLNTIEPPLKHMPERRTLTMSENDDLLPRFRGMFWGLVVGDCLGSPIQFSEKDHHPHITEMVACPIFHTPPGYWTDDSSMAFCVADSVVRCGKYDLQDIADTFVRWYREGFWSSLPHAFDVGHATQEAIYAIENGSLSNGFEESQGNGSIMRLAPSYILNYGSFNRTILHEVSDLTHNSGKVRETVDLMDTVLDEHMQGHRTSIKSSYETRDEVDNSGWAVSTLQAALWAFQTTETFEDGMIAAVNLGGDSDTIGAVYGQIAGAYYGFDAIPERWLSAIKDREKISELIESFLKVAVK